jgi:hypothetical protein
MAPRQYLSVILRSSAYECGFSFPAGRGHGTHVTHAARKLAQLVSARDSEGGKVLDFADGCHVWCHINGGQAASGAQVAAVSRSADNSDLVIIRMNNCVHTARCG